MSDLATIALALKVIAFLLAAILLCFLAGLIFLAPVALNRFDQLLAILKRNHH